MVGIFLFIYTERATPMADKNLTGLKNNQLIYKPINLITLKEALEAINVVDHDFFLFLAYLK